MSTIIRFPEEKSHRVLTLRRHENRRLIVVSSLFSILLVGVLIQMQVEQVSRTAAYALKNERMSVPGEAQRAVASLDTAGATRDLDWEKQLAAKLKAFEPRTPASIGSHCEGALCVLGPSYRIIYQNGVHAAAFPEELSEDGMSALPSTDVPRILKGMRGTASVPYDSFNETKGGELELPADQQFKAYELTKDGEAQGYAVVKEVSEQIRSLVFCPKDGTMSECLKELE